MSERGLDVRRDGDVLRVTLDRPERRNAFDAALISALADAFADVGDARCVVLAGAGPSFCAGADIDWQRSAIDLSYEENVEDAMRLYRMLEAIDGCPAPVVARVHGHALAGGSALACLRRHHDRVARRSLRVHRGTRRHHSGDRLALCVPADRSRRCAALLPHRRALRRRRGAPHRPRPRGRRGSRRARRRCLRLVARRRA